MEWVLPENNSKFFKEGAMRAIHSFMAVFNKLASRLRASGKPTFYCGECERWERCGQPPSVNCIIRAAQMARDGERRNRRARWWQASLGA
jgi:hypothetical protein